MNRREKGNKNELYVQKFFESKGFTCHRARPSIFPFTEKKKGAGKNDSFKRKIGTRSNDIFKVFDIIAKKENSPTYWIQVSTGSRKAEKQKKIKAIGNIYNSMDKVQLWLSFGEGVWKIYELIDGEMKMIAKIERKKYLEVKDE